MFTLTQFKSQPQNRLHACRNRRTLDGEGPFLAVPFALAWIWISLGLTPELLLVPRESRSPPPGSSPLSGGNSPIPQLLLTHQNSKGLRHTINSSNLKQLVAERMSTHLHGVDQTVQRGIPVLPFPQVLKETCRTLADLFWEEFQ